MDTKPRKMTGFAIENGYDTLICRKVNMKWGETLQIFQGTQVEDAVV